MTFLVYDPDDSLEDFAEDEARDWAMNTSESEVLDVNAEKEVTQLLNEWHAELDSELKNKNEKCICGALGTGFPHSTDCFNQMRR